MAEHDSLDDFDDMSGQMVKIIDRLFVLDHQFTQEDLAMLSSMTKSKVRTSVTVADDAHLIQQRLLNSGMWWFKIKKSVGPITRAVTDNTAAHLIEVDLIADPSIADDLENAFHGEVDTLEATVDFKFPSVIRLLSRKPAGLKHVVLTPHGNESKVDTEDFLAIIDKAMEIGLSSLVWSHPYPKPQFTATQLQRFFTLSSQCPCQGLTVCFDGSAVVDRHYQAIAANHLIQSRTFTDQVKVEDDEIILKNMDLFYPVKKGLVRYLRTIARHFDASAAPYPKAPDGAPEESEDAEEEEGDEEEEDEEAQRENGEHEEDPALKAKNLIYAVPKSRLFSDETMQHVILFATLLSRHFDTTHQFLSHYPNEPFLPGWQVKFSGFIHQLNAPQPKCKRTRLRLLGNLMEAAHFFDIPELRWFVISSLVVSADDYS